MVEMSEYVVDAWIHPKYGGDDHQVKITFQAVDLADATKYITAHLKRKSAVVDFRFVSGKGVN